MKRKNNGLVVNVFCEYFLFRSLRDQIGFSYLKSAATGGAALGPDTFKFFVNMGIPLRQLYGQTEQLGAYTIHRETYLRTKCKEKNRFYTCSKLLYFQSNLCKI